MPFKRRGKCVFKIIKNNKQDKKKGCSKSTAKAKKYVKALNANSDDLMAEIKDYFKNQKDEGYLEFDNHPLSSIEALMDPEKPAPWDHLVNTVDDEDVDVKIKEKIKK